VRISSSVVSISWIPSEAIKGSMKLPFELGMAHYDEPLPDKLSGWDELEQWRRDDRFRFANVLEGWVEVTHGTITGFGQSGGGAIGATTVRFGPAPATFPAVAFDDLRPDPEVGDGWVKFRQSAGGRTGIPAPRRVSHAPFVQYHAPIAWSSLALTIHADGHSEWEVEGASPFPRHWFYDADGNLAGKTGMIDFKEWFRHAFGAHTPWGNQDSPTVVTAVESALEREMSLLIMKQGKPKIRRLKVGDTLARQGEEATDLYLLVDGVITVDVDGNDVASLGPGAFIGERAVLEGRRRTATLTAATPCKVAQARKVELDLEKLAAISEGHRSEESVRR
jgi:hypothetical protein